MNTGGSPHALLLDGSEAVSKLTKQINLLDWLLLHDIVLWVSDFLYRSVLEMGKLIYHFVRLATALCQIGNSTMSNWQQHFVKLITF